jgi:predicted metalloenzyme YecM
MTKNTLDEIFWDTDIFFSRIFKVLDTIGIDVSQFELDHFCYRVETIERYEELKKLFEEHWKLLSEKEINGRSICSYKLSKPIVYGERKIFVVELPSPKEWSPYKEWLEHVEFVIDCSFEEFMNQYKNIDFDFDIKAINKEINPDIGIEHEWVRVKFHHNTLEYVIKFLE